MTRMSEELNQAASVIRAAYDGSISISQQAARLFTERRISRVIVAARGSSLNAALVFKFLLDTTSSFVTAVDFPSVITLYDTKRDLSDAAYIIVSQSGKSADTVKLARSAKASGAITVAVTNDATSPLANIADFVLDIAAGEEKAVAATKTFTGEVAALYALSDALRKKRRNVGAIIEAVESALKTPVSVSERAISAQRAVCLSRGYCEPVARECALKLSETCYLYTYTSSVNEFRHGPQAIVSEGDLAVLVAPSGKATEDFLCAAENLKSMGAYLVVITDNEPLYPTADCVLSLPRLDEEEAPFACTVKIQQFVEALCVKKGLNPDSPRRLEKVTITY